MKHSLWILAAAAVLLGSSGPQAYAQNSQQAKMTSCNADAKAKSLTGDDRKKFMKDCLSASPAAAPALNSQQQKMKTCNADAKTKGLAGAERKKFMSDCLKGS